MRDPFSYARKRSLVCVSLNRYQFLRIFRHLALEETLSIYRRARSCPDLPGLARLCGAMGWDQSYTPLTRPRLNPPPGRWPPAGVSNQLQTLAGSHNIACKLHAITEDFQSSREAPKPHFPTFATFPSENLDFLQKNYFYLRRSGGPSLEPPWGLPKT